MIPDDEYPRLIRSTRIVATMFILILGGNACRAVVAIPKYVDIWENMVAGGRDALPSATKLLFENQLPMMGLAVLLILGGLLMVWLSSRLSRIVLVAGVAAALLLLIVSLVDFVTWTLLITITTPFQSP